jgi:hypothetical protein
MTRRVATSALLAVCLLCAKRARAEGASVARTLNFRADSSRDGVYDRFDGDLDLGLALGAELGSAGTPAPMIGGSAHYFSMAGLYAGGRYKASADSGPSLFDLGVDVRPLFVPRWAKGYETGPAFLDLALDSASLSLGAFWTAKSDRRRAGRGFEAGLGFGLPLLCAAAGPWLEVRGLLRYPDAGRHEEAVTLALAWHGFVLTPLVASQSE